MNDTGTLAVFALAVLLLVILTMQMDASTIALIGGIIMFFLVCRRKERDNPEAYSMFNPAMMSSFDAPAQDDGGSTMGPPADTTPIYSGKGANVDAIAALEKSQRPPAPVYSDPTDANRARISKSNALAIGELYGRRSAGTMDNATYIHTQRIGDRERQSIINQIKSRRNNVYEPMYRQELSENSTLPWWGQNEDVLATKLDKRQMDTIDMGRFSNGDSDLDGIYGQQ
jgi:hypothetical protein